MAAAAVAASGFRVRNRRSRHAAVVEVALLLVILLAMVLASLAVWDSGSVGQTPLWRGGGGGGGGGAIAPPPPPERDTSFQLRPQQQHHQPYSLPVFDLLRALLTEHRESQLILLQHS